MSIQYIIETRLEAAFEPVHLEVVNESGNHNVPPGSESHFRVVLVSDRFEGERLVQRHRQVNRVLSDELENHIHALSILAWTVSEWAARQGEAPESPPCHGGST